MNHNTEGTRTPMPKTSNPAQNAMTLVGLHTLEDLTRITEKELLALHGMGPKAVHILRETMAAQGLVFASPTPEQKK